MKKLYFRRPLMILLVGALSTAIPCSAGAYLALPGSTWGEVATDSDGYEGLGSQGFVNQGVDWVRLPGQLILNTSVEMDWQFRSHHTRYYNVYGPLLSIDLRRSFYRFGAEFADRRYPELGETSYKVRPFATWYKDWLVRRFPGDTWGRVTYSSDRLEGFSYQGYVNQGIRWDVLPAGLPLDTFAEYRWRMRTENQDYYNAHGPAIGVSTQWSHFRAGVEYYWQFLPNLGQHDNRFFFFLNWYADWDLKR